MRQDSQYHLMYTVFFKTTNASNVRYKNDKICDKLLSIIFVVQIVNVIYCNMTSKLVATDDVIERNSVNFTRVYLHRSIEEKYIFI